MGVSGASAGGGKWSGDGPGGRSEAARGRRSAQPEERVSKEQGGAGAAILATSDASERRADG